jgi:hypothetical protein
MGTWMRGGEAKRRDGGRAAPRYRLRAEAGMSLSGLIVALAVCGALALVAVRVTPAYLEYRAVKSAVVKAKAAGGTVGDMRQAFDRNAGVNDVTSIAGRDLVFSRGGDGATEIGFAYERRVPLAGNVSLLFDFAGSTDGSTAKTATADQ